MQASDDSMFNPIHTVNVTYWIECLMEPSSHCLILTLNILACRLLIHNMVSNPRIELGFPHFHTNTAGG